MQVPDGRLVASTAVQSWSVRGSLLDLTSFLMPSGHLAKSREAACETSFPVAQLRGGEPSRWVGGHRRSRSSSRRWRTEACADLGIPTEVLLVMPPRNFVKESVADSGPHWVDAYWNLIDRSNCPRG